MGFDIVDDIPKRARGRRAAALVVASLSALAAIGVGVAASASADDPNPIAVASVDAIETLEGLRAAEFATATPPDRSRPILPGEAAELGLPEPAPVDVRVLWYRTTYYSELTDVANQVAQIVQVDPAGLLEVWTTTSDERMRAVLTALSQLGDPYVWGSEGDESFDCSGLTRFAWAASEVALPHWSLGQANSGQPVDPADIKPGDLVHRPGHIMMSLGLEDTIVQSTKGQINGVQLGRWGAADAWTDPLTKRTVRWRVADPIIAADPVAPEPAPAPAEPVAESPAPAPIEG
jgi:mRNA-degrading endonuclease toxin of MazEF toxin-antitoxin module